MYTSEDLYADDLEIETVQEGEQEQELQQENDDVDGDDEVVDRKVIKPKRVLQPRHKLDANLLTGPKGLSVISGYFKNVKYKGKGYEEQDLSVMMKIYEHWCHRLFPKYPFDDCLEKIETLGNKRAVMVKKPHHKHNII